MKTFHHKESYKHLFAKQLMYQWLQEYEDRWMYNNYDGNPKWRVVQYFPLSWDAGERDMHMELPFYETSDPYYFTKSKGIIQDKYLRAFASTMWNPDFNRGKILFVPDIVIFENGRAAYIVEIVHKNSISDYKLKTMLRFFGNNIAICEISAEWILSQIQKPNRLDVGPVYQPLESFTESYQRRVKKALSKGPKHYELMEEGLLEAESEDEY
jgi:hypothetical protein